MRGPGALLSSPVIPSRDMHVERNGPAQVARRRVSGGEVVAGGQGAGMVLAQEPYMAGACAVEVFCSAG